MAIGWIFISIGAFTIAGGIITNLTTKISRNEDITFRDYYWEPND